MANKRLEQDFESQLAESISAEVLFNGQEMEKQAAELRKLLIVAGLNVEKDLKDAEIMDIVSNVI